MQITSDHDGTLGEASAMCIDCQGCAFLHTDACGDCVVTFVLNREPDDAVIIDAAEARGLRLLEQAGLVPRIRFEARGA
jgi:hypothetical protein